MSDSASPYLKLHVPPDEMVKYIQDLMTLPHGEIAASSALTLAQRQWGGDTPLARAALLRWGALNLAFQDKRLATWTVMRERDRIREAATLAKIRDTALRVCAKKGYGASRLAVMPDHLHLAVRGAIAQAPEAIALSLLNNLAYGVGQRAWWESGYYAGTFGESANNEMCFFWAYYWPSQGSKVCFHTEQYGGHDLCCPGDSLCSLASNF